MNPTLVTQPHTKYPVSPVASLYYGVDVLAGLKLLGDQSVHCCVTSPPYFSLRSYLDNSDPLKKHEIGLEPTQKEYIAAMVTVFSELWRVLRDDGVVWLNLGDSYCGGGRAGSNPEYQAKHTMFGKTAPVEEHGKYGLPSAIPEGLKPKDLAGTPHRVAFALQDAGWYLRQVAPWIKGSAMPESCTDRPSSATEYIFMLTKQPKYYYDMDAVRVSDKGKGSGNVTRKVADVTGDRSRTNTHMGSSIPWEPPANGQGRNRRNSDWFYESLAWSDTHPDTGEGRGMLSNESGEPLAFSVNPQPYHGSHFAVMPERLVLPCVLASTSAYGCCSTCGAGYLPVTDKPTVREHSPTGTREMSKTPLNVVRAGWRNGGPVSVHTGWQATCDCNPGQPVVPAVVLDPFSGSGTVAKVALDNGRHAVGIDLNSQYLPMAVNRIQGLDAPEAPKPESAETQGSTLMDLFSE